jgi:hypothetical protein
LFNLTSRTSFPCRDHYKAIGCGKEEGPHFGRGELAVGEEPFNRQYACLSWANRSGYKIPKNSEGINMLTNKKSVKQGYNDICYFTISSIEVWGVRFKD